MPGDLGRVWNLTSVHKADPTLMGIPVHIGAGEQLLWFSVKGVPGGNAGWTYIN